MSRRQKYVAAGKSIALAVLLLSVAGLMLYRVFFVSPPQAVVQVYQCADLAQGCRVSLEGKTLEIGFSAKPDALHPFLLTVKMEGLKQVSASFAMAGMEMGENQYQLIPAAAHVWQAKAILPVCVAGRRDWVLTLLLDNVRVQIPFSA